MPVLFCSYTCIVSPHMKPCTHSYFCLLMASHVGLAGCGGVIHSMQGLITSPNYPQRYNTSIECVWDVIVANGYHVVMTFVGQFDLEISNPCTADYVEVFTTCSLPRF